MKNPIPERLQILVQAWRQNKQPRYATEFDDYLQLLNEQGQTLTTIAQISWNGLRDRYEMEPVVEAHKGTYSLTELVLPSKNFENLKQFFGHLGVHVLLRVRVAGQVTPEPQPNIPASCFPTIVDR